MPPNRHILRCSICGAKLESNNLELVKDEVRRHKLRNHPPTLFGSRAFSHDKAKPQGVSSTRQASARPALSSPGRNRKRRIAPIVAYAVASAAIVAGSFYAAASADPGSGPSISLGAGPTLYTPAPTSTPSPFELYNLVGDNWDHAFSTLDAETAVEGEVLPESVEFGTTLKFAGQNDSRYDDWTVCDAELTKGPLSEPGWRVTIALAGPADSCATTAAPSDEPAAEEEVPTWGTGDTASPDTGGSGYTPGATTSREVRPGAWCSSSGARGRTSAGTLMECRNGAGQDLRWRRAS
jgi:hypothetical protein